MQMNHLERTREFFKNDHYATDATGIVIEKVGTGYSEISLELDTRHKNGIGQVMGAVYTTMADFAFAVASNFDRPMTVTLQTSISFMNACRGDKLYAICNCKNEGGHTCFYDVHITDNKGTDIARASITGYKLNPNFKHPMAAGEDPFREQQMLLDRAMGRE